MRHQDHRSWRFDMSDLLNGLVLTTCCLLGVSWVLGRGPLVLPVSSLNGVHLGGVVCLALMAMAAALPRRFNMVPLALVAMSSAIALYTIAEYTLHVSLPLDAWLARVDVLSAGPHTGWRMGFTPAICALYAGLAVALPRLPCDTPICVAVRFAAPCIAILLALHSFFVAPYFLNHEDYSPLRAIAPQSLVLYGLFGMTLILRAWLDMARVQVQRLDHALAWCTLGLAALVLVIWDYEERGAWNQRAYETSASMAASELDFSGNLKDLVQSENRLAKRWGIYGQPSPAEWQQDARTTEADYPALSAISYVDADRILRWRVSRELDAAALGGVSMQTDPAIRATFDAVDRTASVQMSPQVEVLPGVLGSFIIAPIYDSGMSRGYVMASLKDADLQKAAQSTISGGFEFVILNGYSVLAGTMPHAVEPGNRLQNSKVMYVFGQSWLLTIWPSEAYIISRRTSLQDMTLLLGLLAAALVGLTLIQTRRGKFNQDRADALSVRLATTMENISDAFMTIDRSRRVTYVNAEALRLGQRQVGELIPLPQPASPGKPATYEMAAGVSRALEGTSSVRFTSLLRKTGLWVEANAYPMPNGVAMHFRDITEERARAAHLRLLETAVARQNDVLIISEAIGEDHPKFSRIVYVNDAFTRLTGFTREEVMGRSPNMMQGLKTDRSELRRIGETLKRCAPVQAELLNYHKDGSEYWVELDIAPLMDETGRCTHFVAVVRDITRRRQVQDAMVLAQERFQRLAEATNDIVWDADFTTGTIWFNENFQVLLGYDPVTEAPTMKDWETFVHPDDLPRVLNAELQARAAHAPQVTTEYRMRRADGSYATVVDRAKIIRNADDEVIRMVGAIEDVSERRAMAARLNQSQQLEVIGQLTGGVAHDFNNLLTVILGSSELLSDRLQEQPKLKKLADTAITAALRGSDMTSRLLAFARRQPLDPKVVEVAAQLDGMDDWLTHTLPESIAIDIRTAPDIWRIEVDPSQLETALLNIAVNARDAMPDGGHLVVRAENLSIDHAMFKGIPEAVAGDYVCISISDTGIGMDAPTIAHAFDPFFTTKNMGKGNGLGLSMVYGFVRQSNGFALITSTVGQGTTVKLYFPRSTAERSAEPEFAEVEATPGGHEHILVVEDDDMLRENVVTQLTQLGYRVNAAAAGSAALTILRQEPGIDLLFTDIVMPGDMSGPELVVQALVLRPDLKVLYTSGYSDAKITHDGRLDPGVQLLPKPYRLAEMARKIRFVIET